MFHRLRALYCFAVLHFFLYSSAQVAQVRPDELPKPPLKTAEILQDTEGRIHEGFHIPAPLLPRVAFWFDVYTKYGFAQRVIHHSSYPWWVAEVVDVTEILSAPTRAQWLNVEKAERFSKQRLSFLRSTFQKMSKKIRRQQPLDEIESAWMKKVENLPGSAIRNLAHLAGELRIQTGQKDEFLNGLQKSTRYLEFMDQIFESHGLPTELARLPLVESSFNEEAGSKVGALGIWQLMPAVSKKFITVNSEIDERKSPYKATYVAARMFRENYQLLDGTWPLVVSAYNHGPGGLRRAVKNLSTYDLQTIIENYRSNSFSFASENFYCEFLGALFAQKYSPEIFGDVLGHEFAHVNHLSLPRKIKTRELVRLSELPTEEFLSYNPDLKKAFRSNLPLPKGFRIFLPVTRLNIVLDALEKMIRVAQK